MDDTAESHSLGSPSLPAQTDFCLCDTDLIYMPQNPPGPFLKHHMTIQAISVQKNHPNPKKTDIYRLHNAYRYFWQPLLLHSSVL